MNSKVIFALVLVTAVAGNPFEKDSKNLIHRRATVSPNLKVASFEKIAKSAVAKPAQEPIPGPKVKVEGCGQATSADSKIVGGYEATPHSYPWQVALYIDNLYFCGGSIISNSWILTAAHCVDGAASVVVVAGAHNIYAYEASKVTLTSTTYTVHEAWNAGNMNNDIAVIQLPQSLTFNNAIQAICLPSDGDIGAGVYATVTGWGLTSDNSIFLSDVLMKADVTTAAQSYCENTYGSSFFTDDMICVSSAGGTGPCQGDSGGPLNYYSSAAGCVEVRGVTSYVADAGCEAGYPSSFTRVNHYLAWIETKTGVTV